MSAAAVLADLDAAGATVAVEGDRLRLRAPSGVLTDALHARIVAHREGIVAALVAARPGTSHEGMVIPRTRGNPMEEGRPYRGPDTPRAYDRGAGGTPLAEPARWPARLIPSGVCLDCGGPCPADGMHWCGACRTAIAPGETAP